MARNKSLKAGLANKAVALRTKQETQTQASLNFIAASAQAEEEARVAARHAAAVEQAVSILEEAGVAL